MKNNIFTTLAVIGVALLFYFSVSAFSSNEKKLIPEYTAEIQSSARDTFTNCIFNASFNEIFSWQMVNRLHVARNLDKYRELNFNAVHSYDETGSRVYGKVDSLLSPEQITRYQDFLDSVDTYGNLYGFFERSFISKYCYGQRLIYEVAQDSGNKTLNLGFAYQTRERGNYEMDGNRTVIHATPGLQDSGYLCRDIYENIQHSDLFDFRQNDKGTWYIKPVMRIPTGMSPGIPVVRIEIIPFGGGVPVKQVTINTEDFNDIVLYDGSYKEIYPAVQPPLTVSGDTNSTNLNFGRDENWQEWDANCKVDFRVFWYGECEVWFDRMIVDDEVANDLFDPALQIDIDTRIYAEVSNFTNYGGLYSFFMDEICISQYPCIQYIAKKMRDYEPESKLSIAVTNYLHIHGLKNDSLSYQVYLDSIKPNFLQCDHHGFSDVEPMIPDVFPNPDTKIPPGWFESNLSKYNSTLQNKVFGSSTDIVSNDEIGSLIYEIKKTKGNINQFGSSAKFIMQPQIHGWIFTNDISYDYAGGLREPTNEEIQAQAMISIAHGAEGLCWFVYNSHTWDDDSNGIADKYMLGLLDPVNDTAKRISNDYGQNKWTYVSAMNGKILKWLPVLENTYWQEGLSVHQEGAGNKYIKAIKSIYRNASNQFVDDPSCTNCDNIKYWEIGYFVPNDQTDKSKYFLIVNRRCVPETDPGVGDIRQLKIKFDSTQLNGFNNWKIINVENDSLLTTFNKNTVNYIDAGIFQPGEGKLFKLAPVMQEGGTFVCDEYVNTNLTCNGMVYGNGHNITINHGKTISFSEDGGLYMEGGCFVSGINSDNADAVTFQGTGGANHWKGITLNGCDSVGIYNTTTSNAESNDTPKTYSYSIINTYKVDFRKCNFNTENNRGIIEAVYNGSSLLRSSFKIRESNFYMENCGYPAINVISNASASIPLIAEWCTFHSKDNDTSCAIMLTGVTGGVVKNCYFYDFGKTILFISSSIDLYGNLILGGNNSEGIQCLSGSSVSLGPHSGMYLGGYNYLRNYGTTSSNIRTDNSFFDIDCGNNEFDIDETDYSKHLTGTMISDDEPASVYAYKNCFHEDSITNIEAIHDVIWSGTNSNVNFLFEPYFCDLTQLQDFVVFEAYGFPDTVYYKSGGEGGGFNPNKSLNIEENTYKSLIDTVNINLRKRNYQTVETNSKLILTQYPDSLESIGMVQKLYMASLNLDSTRIGITKTFLENLISNNTQNPSLIKRAFYFIQKCKVKLGQFQSALEGFQYIMTQNPYTYEGLVASWDYAATYLLMGTGGSFQGDNEQSLEDLTTPTDTLLSRMSKRDINTNRNSNNSANEKITKIFYEKIKITTKDDRSKQEEKVKTLEKTLESSKSTTEKNEAARELAVMKQIKEAVKIKKPKTVINHVQIMNDDIKKVFGVGKKSSKESMNSLIPQTYQLYQNYPNPFNPTTKIAFDLPKDAKVKLVIYDILGREMKTLVNNEFRSAGKYITEFNGSNMASGVYFARILVNEGKDFIAVKKMVYVK